MAQCSGFKRNGERCTLQAQGDKDVCWAHDPANARERRSRASKGGRSKASKEIKDLKQQLENLAEDVLEDRVERGVAIVINQILNTRLRLIELERKIREQEELEERIAALEGKGKWGG